MAQTFPPAEIKITAKANEAIAEFHKLNKEINAVEKNVVKSSNAMKSMNSSISLMKRALAGLGIGATFAYAVREFGQLEANLKQLAVAMSNVGLATDENNAKIQKTLVNLEKLGFDAGYASDAISILITATGDLALTQQYLATAADVARFKNISLSDAARTLAKANEGNARAFKEFGVSLDTTLPKQAAIAKAMAELNQKVGGQAVAYTKTFRGQLDLLYVELNNIAEVIGSYIVPVILGFIDALKQTVYWFNQNQTALFALAGVIAGVVIVALVNMARSAITAAIAMSVLDAAILAIPLAIAGITAAFVYFWNKFQGFRDGVIRGLEAIMNVVGLLIRAVGFAAKAFIMLAQKGGLPAILDAIGYLVPAAKDAATALRNLSADAVEQEFINAAKRVEDFGDSLTKLRGKQISFKLPDLIKLPKLPNGKPIIPGLDPETQKQLETINKKLADLYEKRAKIIRDGEDKIADIRLAYSEKVADLQKQYAKDVASAQKDAAKRIADIVKQSIDSLRDAFRTSTYRTITDLYDALTFQGRYAKGGGISALVTGLGKQLGKAKTLAANAAALAGLGFNQAFIQEVVALGPDMGNKLAENIKNSTPEQITELQKTWEDLNKVSGHGVDALAEQLNSGMNLVTEELMNQVVAVREELNETLSTLAVELNDNLTDAFKDFQKSISDAQKDIAESLAEINKDIAETLAELAKLGVAQSTAKFTVPTITTPSGGTTIIDNKKTEVKVDVTSPSNPNLIAGAIVWGMKTSSDVNYKAYAGSGIYGSSKIAQKPVVGPGRR